MKSVGRTILALTLGVAIGAGVGVLFAPDKGKRTRRKIKRGYDNYLDKITDKIEDLRMKEKELVKKARKMVDGKMHEMPSNN